MDIAATCKEIIGVERGGGFTDDEMERACRRQMQLFRSLYGGKTPLSISDALAILRMMTAVRWDTKMLEAQQYDALLKRITPTIEAALMQQQMAQQPVRNDPPIVPPGFGLF